MKRYARLLAMLCSLIILGGCSRGTSNQITPASTASSVITQSPYDQAIALFDQEKYYESILILRSLGQDSQALELLDKAYQQILLAPVCVNGQGWGYVDPEGNMVIEPHYTMAGPFSEGKAIVQIDGSTQRINKQGASLETLPVSWKEIGCFANGLACFSVESTDLTYGLLRYGCIDEQGNVVIDAIFCNPIYFQGGVAKVIVDPAVRKDVNYFPDHGMDECLFLTKEGNLHRLSDVQHYGKNQLWLQHLNQDNAVAYAKSSGSFAWLEYFDKPDFIPNEAPERWIFLNNRNQMTVNTAFEAAGLFNGGLAPVKRFEMPWGFIDMDGNDVIKAQYEEAKRFSQGLAAVKLEGKWGYINTAGEMVIKPQFSDASNFSEGLAPVAVGEGDTQTWGFIDKTGAFKIEPTLGGVMVEGDPSYQRGFSCGKALVKPDTAPDGLWGVMDTEGKISAAAQFRTIGIPIWAGVFHADHVTKGYGYYNTQGAASSMDMENPNYINNEGICRIRLNKGNTTYYAYQNDEGILIEPTKWVEATDFNSDGYAGICVGYDEDKFVYGKWGVINPKGDVVTEPSLTIDEVYRQLYGAWYEFDNIKYDRDLESILTSFAMGEVMPIYDSMVGVGDEAEGYILFEEKGKFGFMDTEGNVTIPLRYDHAGYFGR